MELEKYEYLKNLEKTDFKAYLETSLSSTEHIEFIVMQYEETLDIQKKYYKAKVSYLENEVKECRNKLHERNLKIIELIADIQNTLLNL